LTAPSLGTGSDLVQIRADPGFLLESLRIELLAVKPLVTQALAADVQKCLSPLGYTYLAPPPAEAAGPASRRRLWDLPDSETAGVAGYGGVLAADPAAVDDQLDPGYEQALMGQVVGEWADPDPPDYAGAPVGGEIYDGCLPTARTHVVGGDDPARAFLDNDLYYQIESLERLASDGLVASESWGELEGSWLKCMKDRGFIFKSLSDPLGLFAESDPPSAQEIATAVADVQCKEALDFVRQAEGLFGDELARVAETHMADITKIQLETAQLADRATAALDGEA
jgi:hypothetical protein